MTNYYLKAKRQAKFERFAEIFALCAAVFALVAVLCAGFYDLGRKRGFVSGAVSVQDCEQAGGNGYFIDEHGLYCIYE